MSDRDVAEARAPRPEAVWIDRGPGSGSLGVGDAHAEETAREGSHDGRAVTRTTFYSSPADDEPTVDRSWEELASLNDDMRHPDRGTQNHHSYVARTVEILCGELDCTEYQAERVSRMLDDVGNLRELLPTRSVEMIALGAISLVVDSETTEFENWIVRRDDFRDLMDDVGMDVNELWSIREKLRSESDMFDG